MLLGLCPQRLYISNERAILFESAYENCALFSSMNKVDKFKINICCLAKVEVARFCKNAFNSRHDLLQIDCATCSIVDNT